MSVCPVPMPLNVLNNPDLLTKAQGDLSLLVCLLMASVMSAGNFLLFILGPYRLDSAQLSFLHYSLHKDTNSRALTIHVLHPCTVLIFMNVYMVSVRRKRKCVKKMQSIQSYEMQLRSFSYLTKQASS